MPWEVVLALILAIGIGISVKGALNKRCANRSNSKCAAFEQRNTDQVDKEPATKKYKEP
ncbi:hypothetical protein ACFLYM_02335 [Chloroflexota bacterium]